MTTLNYDKIDSVLSNQIAKAINDIALITVTDKDGVITYANDRFCEVSKYTREELVGVTHKIFNSGFHTSIFFKNLWDTIKSAVIWHGEINNLAKDGTAYWVHTTIFPQLDDNNNLSRYISVSYLITEQKILESKLIQEENLLNLRQLISSIGHEIGTPLSVIRSRAELTKMMAASESSTTRNLDTIINQVDKITSLVNSMVLLTSNSNKNNLKQVAIMPTLKFIIDLYKPELFRKGIVCEFMCKDEHSVFAEPGPLGRVFMHLLRNSINAIEKNRLIGSTKKNSISIVVTSSGKNIQIKFSDTGCGIEPKLLPKIFTPFFTTMDFGKGAGLGLSISASLIKSWHGTISAESELNCGTTFTIYLPSA